MCYSDWYCSTHKLARACKKVVFFINKEKRETNISFVCSHFSVVSVEVEFTYPPTYPDVTPGISIISYDGVSEEQMTELEAHLVSVVSEYFMHN